MNRLLVLLVFLPVLCRSAVEVTGGPDYSRDAGNIYYCSSTGTAVSPAGITLSSPTISLWNPPGSGKNMVVLDVGINITAAPAAAADFLLAFSSTVAPSSPTFNNYSGFVTTALIGKSTTTSVGYCLVNANLVGGTPKAFRYLGGTTGAAAISGVTLTDPTNGKVVVPPGMAISLQATTAAQITAHITEREEPQ